MDEDAATFHQIEHWFEHVFKHAGWMILAKAEGKNAKVKAYKEGMHHLMRAIDAKIKMVEEKDRREDLMIMKRKLKVLCDHVKIDMPSSLSPRRRSSHKIGGHRRR